MVINQVITKSYPENLEGGFMVCGINYGYSVADEEKEKVGTPVEVENQSFFSDATVRKTDRFKNRVLKWLRGWGLEFVTTPGIERAFERSFFQCNWLDSQTRSVGSDVQITNEVLVNEAEGFLSLLAQRKPSVIFLFGSKLIEALNDERIRPRVIAIFGERTTPKIYTANIPDYQGKKFPVRVQKFGETVVISSPHPQAQGLSDAYMTAIKLPIFAMEKLVSKCFNLPPLSLPSDEAIQNTNEIMAGFQDPLFPEAASTFNVNQELPVSALQRQFRIGYGRAVVLYKALVNAQPCAPGDSPQASHP